VSAPFGFVAICSCGWRTRPTETLGETQSLANRHRNIANNPSDHVVNVRQRRVCVHCGGRSFVYDLYGPMGCDTCQGLGVMTATG